MTLWPWQETIPTPEGGPYLTRYTLLWTPLFRLYLHRIHCADADRDVHNHPWEGWTCILWGGYVEEIGEAIKTPRTYEERKLDAERAFYNIFHGLASVHVNYWYKFGGVRITERRRGILSFGRVRRDAYHRIARLLRAPTWTLCCCGRKETDDWGFLTDKGFVKHTEYERNGRA